MTEARQAIQRMASNVNVRGAFMAVAGQRDGPGFQEGGEVEKTKAMEKSWAVKVNARKRYHETVFREGMWFDGWKK